MAVNTDTDYSAYVKKIFRFSGYLPSHKSINTIISKFILTPMMCVLVTLIIWNFKYKHSDIFEIAANVEALSTHGHVFVRKLVIWKYASALEDFLYNRQVYWSYDLFGKQLGDVFRRKMSIFDLIIKMLNVSIFTTASIIFLSPLLNKNIELPQACYIPYGSEHWRRMIYISQVICLLEALTVAVTMDGTFLLMCGEMEIQFSLLNEFLKSIKIGKDKNEQHEEKCLTKLKICSTYHNILLKIHERLKIVFSEFFLFQFLITIQSLCIEIFVLNKATDNYQFASAFLYIIAVVMQSSFTFLAASNIEIQAETLADAICEIDWYNATNTKIPKHILFMLMKAQEPLILKGSGLFNVNRNTLLLIMRTGFSIYTLMKNFLE